MIPVSEELLLVGFFIIIMNKTFKLDIIARPCSVRKKTIPKNTSVSLSHKNFFHCLAFL